MKCALTHVFLSNITKMIQIIIMDSQSNAIISILNTNHANKEQIFHTHFG